jgi:hypothetical protein
MAAPTGAATAGVAAGRPQPQTTVESPGGPFIRHSQDGRRAMYVATPAAGGLVGNPMVASPGYNKGYRILWNSTTTGGTGGTLTNADAPFNIGTLVTLKDAFGTPIIVAPGWHAFFLVPLYSGQFGLWESAPISSMPDWTSFTAASGAFQFGTYLPWEFAKGYGLISGANASLLPTLQINVGATTFAGAAPTTAPNYTVTVDADFYWLPQGVAVEPPGIGTTCQWVLQPCNPTIASAGSLNVQLPRLGGYLTTIILELRAASGARDADTAWPVRPRFLVDGVPLIDTLLTTLYEDIAIQYGIGSSTGSAVGTSPSGGTAMFARPPGTLALTRKNAMSQRILGLLETGETFLSTNPGTQIEVAGFPWGTNSGPDTLNALVGQVVPSGQLIQGLPEV